jgi:hypothetical protein
MFRGDRQSTETVACQKNETNSRNRSKIFAQSDLIANSTTKFNSQLKCFILQLKLMAHEQNK